MVQLKKFLRGDSIDEFSISGIRGFYHKGKKYIHHSELPHNQTAFYRFTFVQKVILLALLIFLVLGFVIDWRLAATIFVSFFTIVYFADLLFTLYLIFRTFLKSPEVSITALELQGVDDKVLPGYTVLCPLYKEWSVLPQFVNGINKLDYPKNKLQVLLLLEENDTQTIQKAREFDLPANFEIIIVPNSKPKTKPKALNYGLEKSTGEYIVIYDAEDIPEPVQLKKAILAFELGGEKIKCVQAKLNFYNPHQNLLTRVFTAEYSLWFDLVLTGLQSIGAPIPLGGTSNHFRKKDLVKLKGWDAFNVTEDADLGMRIAKNGFKTSIINSTTNEEANSDLKNWFWQRTRWIKGYIQTYFVHMRRPGEFKSTLKDPHLLVFQLVIGGKVASMLINPLMWILTIIYFAFRAQTGTTIESLFPMPILYIGTFSLIMGNFLYFYYYMVGCAKRKQYDIIKYVFIVPLYWLAMSLAAYVAVYKLITQPHYWSKTKHGLFKPVTPVKHLIRPEAGYVTR